MIPFFFSRFFAFFVILISLNGKVDAETCGHVEAYSKRQIISYELQLRLKSLRSAIGSYKRAKALSDLEVQFKKGDNLIAKNEYPKACKYYEELAQRFKINMNQSIGISTSEVPRKKSQEKSKDGCDEKEALDRMVLVLGYIQKLQDQNKAIALKRSFIHEIQSYSSEIVNDPSSYCKRIDSFLSKNKIN